jgi:phenylalanine-4-hydroxylase
LEHELNEIGIILNKDVNLNFIGRIKITGRLTNKLWDGNGNLIMLSFINCTVTHNKTILFQPDWGIYDMVLGKEIVSVFSGSVSYNSFEDDGVILSKKPLQIKYSGKQKLLHNLYKQVRIMRNKNDIKVDILQDIFLKIRNDFSGEWLLVLEIYELLYKSNLSFEKELLKYLESLKENIQISNLISTGLKLIRK